MKKNKKNLQQFLIYMRNGTAFCTTWFLILILGCSHIFQIHTISINLLTKIVFLIIGGVLIFSSLFTQIFINRWCFTKRLNCFMLFISLYECIGFYWIGLFEGTGSFIQWSSFIGIICVLYFLCIIIYQRYSRRQGEMYTQVLKQYQQHRRNENGQ